MPSSKRVLSTRARRPFKRLSAERLEMRRLLTVGGFDLPQASQGVPPAAMTALLLDGTTLEDLVEQSATEQVVDAGGAAPDASVASASNSAPPNALITVGELDFNDTLASADSVPLGFDATEDFAVDVVGTLDGPLGSEWSLSSSNPSGRIQVSGAFGTAAGPAALLMDVAVTSTPNLNEAVLTVDLSSTVSPVLSFSYAEWGDETAFLPASFTGSFNGDGVAISEDGNTWHTILNAWNSPNGLWQNANIDLASAASTAGISLSSEFQIKFQQFDNFPLTLDGRGYDEVVITDGAATVYSESFVPAPPDVDFFAVELEPGDIFGANVGGGGQHLTFYSPGGTELIGSDQDITGIHPAASPLPGGGNAALSYVIDTAGTYAVAVDQGQGDYTLNLRAFRPVMESSTLR